MNYILIIYGLFLSGMGLKRLVKTENSNEEKTNTSVMEAKYRDSWKKIIILSAILTEFFNLLFLISAAVLVNNRSIEILVYTISVALVIRLLIIIFNVTRFPTVEYYRKVETSFYSIKGKKFSLAFDWVCICSLAIIIGALL